MGKITLRPISIENIDQCFDLAIREDQKKFVASIEKSLAYAYVYREQCQPFAIYAAEKMVGYLLTLFDQEDEMYCLWHMMLDVRYQGCGYGKVALALVLDYFKTFPFGKAESAGLTCHEENQAGLGLYRSLGFKETGEKDEDNELIMIRSLLA